MSFLSNLFKTEKRSSTTLSNYQSQKTLELSNGVSRFDASKPELCSTIYTSVGLIANNISKLDIHVYRKTDKGREIFKDHMWETTLSINPDQRVSTSKWLNFTVTQMLLEGGSYHLKSEYDQNLSIKKELKPLGEIKKIVSDSGEIFYKFKNIDGWIPSSQILFFSYFSKDGLTPISPISALKNELDIQKGAETTISNFYKNGLFQLLFLQVDAEMVGANKNKLKEYFEKVEKDVAGSKNAFSGGIFEIPPMYQLKNIPLPDLKFLESSKFTESRIASIYNIPAYMLNINEGAGGNYSKVEAQQLHFLNNCLSNIINIIKQELQHKILTVKEIQSGVSIDFDYSNLFSIDLESKALYFKTLQSMGAVSPNEIREAFQFERVDSEYMNYHFIQSQNQSIEHYPSWANNTQQAEDKISVDNNINP